jgi:xylulokinase
MTTNSYHKTSSSDKQAYVLAIDLGGGGLKIALVSDRCEVVAGVDEKITTTILHGGGVEQDPEEWWQKALSGSKKVLKAAKVPPADIAAIVCDSQWCLAVPVDAIGHHVMNAIHWLDTRGGPYNRKIASGFPSYMGYNLQKLFKWIRLTGWASSQAGSDSLGHVLFIKNELPDIYAQTFKFLEPMDYLTSRLTGRITSTQKTMVPFCVVDNQTWGCTSYHEALLSMAGLTEEKFPDMIPNDSVVGTLLPDVATELGLDSSTRVVAGISDSNASLIGLGALGDFETVIYIGTSLCMTCHLPFKKTDVAPYPIYGPKSMLMC